MAKVPSLEFTVAEVSEWLNSNGFEAFSEKFHDEDVDGESLAFLTESALESLVDKVGPRMKLLRIINMMKSNPLHGDCESTGGGHSDSRLVWGSESSQNSTGLEDSPRCSSPIISNGSSGSTSPSRRSWVTPFCLPERFPPVVQEPLMKNSCLPKTVRVKFIQAIYDRICLFTMKPGIVSWVTRLRMNLGMKGVIRLFWQENGNKLGPELSTKVPTTSRRGIINWEPPIVDGEDEHSCKAHLTWMQKEIKKRQPNMSVVERKMALTFSFRRNDVDDDDIDEEERLSDAEKVVVAFSVLPFLLERETKKNPRREKYLYQTAEDAERLVKDSNCPMSPFLILTEDADGRVNRIYIAGEKQVLMEADNIIAAVSSLMFIYYVCNLEYPKECFNTLLFLQRAVLKVFDRVKVPTKVLLFLNELYK